MQLITVRAQIQYVAKRWKAQYFHDGEWITHISGNSGDTYDRLTVLDLDNCTARDVDTVIGNTAWTTVYCGECETSVDAAMVFTDGDDETFLLCSDCLRAALDLLPT